MKDDPAMLVGLVVGFTVLVSIVVVQIDYRLARRRSLAASVTADAYPSGWTAQPRFRSGLINPPYVSRRHLLVSARKGE